MTWSTKPTITINGTSYKGSAVGSVSVDYGRTSVWDPQRAGNASIQLINYDNTSFPIGINATVVIKLRNSSDTADITVFTGTITSINNSSSLATGGAFVVYVNITAIAPLSILNRTQSGTVNYPSENESQRISRILADVKVTQDVIDSGTYTLMDRTANPNSALALCNAYALTATGSMYETTDGKVGYANELRRNQDVAANGYFNLSTDYISQTMMKSSTNIADVINNVSIKYGGSFYANTFQSDSIGIYGVIAGTLDTEISNLTDASTLGGIFLGMRAYPQTSLSALDVRLSDPTMDSTTLDAMLSMYFGKPLQVAGLPTSIYSSTYYGFVEGWRLTFDQVQAQISLRTSEKTYSFRFTQWEDVSPSSLTWNGVASTLQWINYQ